MTRIVPEFGERFLKGNEGVAASPPLSGLRPQPASQSSRSAIANAKVWRVTPYMPSHKQFSLSSDLTPERISEITQAKPKPSRDGKCRFQWEFFAARYFTKEDGGYVEIALPCAIWDYKGSRWSAYGPPEAFCELGLLPASALEARRGETGTGSTAEGSDIAARSDSEGGRP